MRRLILLRHAKAKRNAPSGEDFDRPLAERGQNDAVLIGRLLADDGIAPDRVLVSAAQRTQETWRAASAAFPDIEPSIRRDLYLADAKTLLHAIEDEEDADTVMVVAHNPGIHALAVALLRRDSAAPSTVAKLERGFPTATAAVFMIDEAGRATYDGLFLVAEHGGGGGE